MAQENYRSALQSGLLKVMSKMGICTVSAYRGSELFEVIGLAEEVCDLSFRNAPRRFYGLGLAEIGARVLELHSRFADGEELAGGFYKHRSGGNLHITSPGIVLALQKAVRAGSYEEWDHYVSQIESRPPSVIRDLLRFSGRAPIPLEEVEPAEQIMRRFVASAMSMGALSREAHESLAEAMNQIGGYSNSGEGGEGRNASDHLATRRSSRWPRPDSGLLRRTSLRPRSCRSRWLRDPSRARADSFPGTRSRPRSPGCATPSPGSP